MGIDGLRLADELERSHPGAAASLRKGLEETLTLTRLVIRGRLKTTLQSTNPRSSPSADHHRIATAKFHDGRDKSAHARSAMTAAFG